MSLLQSNMPSVAGAREGGGIKERGHQIRVYFAAAVSIMFRAAIGV